MQPEYQNESQHLEQQNSSNIAENVDISTQTLDVLLDTDCEGDTLLTNMAETLVDTAGNAVEVVVKVVGGLFS